MREMVRIGAGSGFALDSALSMVQLLRRNPPDYIVFDHMAEGMMSPFVMQLQQSPDLGYSTVFIDVHIGPYLAEIMKAGVKIISNAGGLNPHGAAAALQKRAAALGLTPKIAVVTGDDLRGRLGELAGGNYREMFTGEPWPTKLLAANAYFGGFPIAEALRMGADIVITGRVVDSALALGPSIHEFGWQPTDYDLLAAGTAVGHLLECGTQSTGGTFTDWLEDVPDWDNLGFPIAECRPSGDFVITKPEGTGGLVSIGTVAEQLLYEVSDPAAYLVPDVACDFAAIQMREVGANRVEVTNARGRAPSGSYKVCGIIDDGWKVMAMIPVLGINAAAKARRLSEGIFGRAQNLLTAAGLGPPKATQIDLLGTGETFHVGPASNSQQTEIVCRVAFVHDDVRAARIFFNETFSPSTNGCPGAIPSWSPMLAPVHRLYSFLMPRDKFAATVTLGETAITLPAERIDPPAGPAYPSPQPNTAPGGGEASVPLIALAWGRSGDKGNLYNVGIIARRPEYLPHIRAALTEDAVAAWLRHTFDDPATGQVRRYDAPGIHAVNFVVSESLRGGAATLLRLDCFAKGMAQQLLQIPIPVPAALARRWDGKRLSI